MSKELAQLFYDQCIGRHDGHMASIPNNPLFSSIFMAAGVSSIHNVAARQQFADVLRNFADHIEKDEQKF